MGRCEVCGRIIIGTPFGVVVEGASLLVCGECSNLSSVKPTTTLNKPRKPSSWGSSSPASKEGLHELGVELELVNDFPKQIKRAREKLQLTHEDLGRKIGEKVSVLQKMEIGKMVPDQILAKKLENILRIKLLTSYSERPTLSVLKPPPPKPTLGELVKIKKQEEVEED